MKTKKKILIVEDEPVIAMDLQSSLEKFGYTVIGHVTRGEDVINSFNAGIPDLILMDIQLEGALDGVETAQIIHENYSIPVIFITSYSNTEIIERAKKTNPFGYIVKPFNDRELLTNIEIAIYKHETEFKLKESERKYRELSESIQQIIVECDTMGNINYINQAGLELLGLTYSEYKNKVRLTDFLTFDSFEFIKNRINGCEQKDDGNLNREHLLINRYGKRYVIEEYLSPVYSRDAITGFRGTLIDITSKTIKETLHALYSKLNLLFNKDTTDPFEIINYLLMELKRHFFYVEEVYFNEYLPDQKLLRIYNAESTAVKKAENGYSEFVMNSKKPVGLLGKELREFNERHHIKIFGRKAVCWMGFPLYYQNRNFGVFALQSYKNEHALVQSDFDNLSVFFDNVNSLFERISYLKNIRQSKEQYKHLVDSINEGLIQADLDGNVTFVNRQLTEITGYSESEFVGKNLITSLEVSPETRATLQKEALKRKDGFSNQYELNIISKSGAAKDLLINASPSKNSQGEVIGSIATVVDITEKKRYLRLIRDSEQKFKAVFEQAAIGVAMLKSDTGYLFTMNRKYCEIVGYTRDELIKMNFMQFTHPEDLEKDLIEMNRILKGEIREFSLEKRLIKKNGEEVWVNLTVSPLWNVGDEPSNHLAIIEDITSRKLIEEELKKSEMEKENILKSMPDSFLVVDRNGTISKSYFNEKEKIVKPVNLSDSNSGNIKTLFPGDLANKFLTYISVCLETLEVGFMEASLQINNSVNWFEIRFSPVNSDFALVIIRNVTGLKNSILEIQKFYNITEQTHELILITDKNGKIEYVNPIFSKVTGYSLKELKGKTPSMFKSHKHPLKFYKEFWDTIKAGRSFKGEFVNLKKNGELFIEEKIVSPVLNNNGEIVNFISTGRDVTEDRKKEKRLGIYQKFEKTLEKKEQKYRTLSLIQGQEKERVRIARELHDGLGQMLTVANANLENLDLSDVKVKEKRVRLEIVKEMVAEIIQESRRISHNLSPVGLYEFGLYEILKQFITRIQNNTDGVSVALDSNIENIRFKIEIEINIYRIIQEGIQNALKHSRAKKIMISVRFENNYLKVKIKDNGIGFDIKQLVSSNKHFNGIRNIEERAKIMDGVLNFKTAKGFEINLVIKQKK